MLPPARGPARVPTVAAGQQMAGYTSSYTPPPIAQQGGRTPSYVPLPQAVLATPSGPAPTRSTSVHSGIPGGTGQYPIGSQTSLQQASAQQQQQQQQQQTGGLQQLVAWAQQSPLQQQMAPQRQQQQQQQVSSQVQQQSSPRPQQSSRQAQQKTLQPLVPAAAVISPDPKGVQKPSGLTNGGRTNLSHIPTPVRSDEIARARSLYLDDRQTIACPPSHGEPPKVDRMLTEAAGGNKALEAALQILLNVQRLDQAVLAKAMLSPKDGLVGLNAMSLMQKITEAAPQLLCSEERLYQSVKALNMHETVNLLKDLGLDEQGIQDYHSLHNLVVQDVIPSL